MLFNSYAFLLVFLPLTLTGYAALTHKSPLAATTFLSMASLAFYGWSSPLAHSVVLLLSMAWNYQIGEAIAGSSTAAARRACLVAGVGVDLLALGCFKYAGFVMAEIGATGWFSDVALPLGISFFTFTQIAYLVDVYQHKVTDRNVTRYMLFVTWFPHLIAGPILHHAEMTPQFLSSFQAPPRVRLMLTGLAVFTVGLAKKVLLADQAAPVANAVFDRAGLINLTLCEAWAGALAYTLQIYFDFSGYSDMAMGISLMFGVRLPLNFNSPYRSTSIIEFWRRWHISLSRFLRDYLYIPLGGGRKGPVRRLLNLMATMLLGGLWHGAGWTFIVWGGLHGAYLMINHAWCAQNWPMPRPLGLIATFLAVVVAWVFFRAPTLSVAGHMLKAMFDVTHLDLARAFSNRIIAPNAALPILLILLAIALAAPNTSEIFYRARPAIREQTTAPHRNPAIPTVLIWRPCWRWGAALGLLLAASFVRLGGDSPFLYFRF